MTARTMSNTLSALDLSELPEPYIPPVTSSAASPPLPQPYVSTTTATATATAATNSRSTSAFNYHSYPPVTPTSLDVWIAASQSQNGIQSDQPDHRDHPVQPAQPDQLAQTPDTPDIPLDRGPSANPAELFSSFLQPTPSTPPGPSASPAPSVPPVQSHSQPRTTSANESENPTTAVVVQPSLQLERTIRQNDHSAPHPVPRHTRTTPPLSQSCTQSDRMIYTAPLRTSTASQAPPLAAPLVTPLFSGTADGLSAVERAKKTADQLTMSQLAKKRKAAGLDPDPKRARNISSSKSSTDDDDKGHQNLPEKISHRKYQKRLQKNRDSAFVSRIRRREYTRLLEESLASTEKEKEAAVHSFLEMKRRFDIVSAELNAFKQAAASNLSAVRDSLFSHLSTTTTDTPSTRSGAVVTSMFMFTLLFGLILPQCIRQQFGLQRYSAESQLLSHRILDVGGAQQGGIRSMLFGSTFSQEAHQMNESRGKVWGQFSKTAYLDEQLDNAYPSCHDDMLSTMRSCLFDLLGAQYSDSFLRLARPHLDELSSKQMERLNEVFRHGNATRFEQLVEIEALARKVGEQRPAESEALLEHVTVQLENARL